MAGPFDELEAIISALQTEVSDLGARVASLEQKPPVEFAVLTGSPGSATLVNSSPNVSIASAGTDGTYLSFNGRDLSNSSIVATSNNSAPMTIAPRFYLQNSGASLRLQGWNERVSVVVVD
jgi:hypothetical protein